MVKMVDQAYKDYINSKEWKKRRKAILKDRPFCEKCNSDSPSLHIHHLTYERFGNELDSDLMVLCQRCHEEVHGRKFSKDGNIRIHRHKDWQTIHTGFLTDERLSWAAKGIYAFLYCVQPVIYTEELAEPIRELWQAGYITKEGDS